MKILTHKNQAYELDMVPNEVEDIRYCVFDCSDSKNIDYFCTPLVFLESFHSPSAVMSIGDKIIQMPLDWSILVCDEEFNDLEILPIASLNDRGFHAFIHNPYTNGRPLSAEINIINIYADVKWFSPKLKTGSLLVTPIETRDKPRCVYFVKEMSKISKFDISDIL